MLFSAISGRNDVLIKHGLLNVRLQTYAKRWLLTFDTVALPLMLASAMLLNLCLRF